MDEVTLTWDVKNWITVLLMVALGGLLLVLAAQLVRQISAGKIDLSPSGLSNSPLDPAT